MTAHHAINRSWSAFFRFVMWVTLSAPSAVRAQEADLDTSSCKALAAVQQKSPRPDPRDLRPAVLCATEGPPALVRAWTTGLAPDEIATLAILARQMRDNRVAGRVMLVAKDTTRSTEERAQALGVLLAFASVEVQLRRNLDGEVDLDLGMTMHQFKVIGSEPLPPEYPKAAARMMYDLALQDPDPIIQRIAASGAERIVSMTDPLALADVTRLTIETICKGRIRITNDLPIRVSYRVYFMGGGAPLSAGIKAKHSVAYNLRSDGPYVLEAAGRVQGQAPAGAPCTAEQQRVGSAASTSTRGMR